MPRISNRSWTPHDLERLKQFAASGASLMRASVALKRTRKSVYARANQLGLSFPKLRIKDDPRRGDPSERISGDSASVRTEL